MANARSGSVRPLDRRHELEQLRRSLAMLSPGTKALSREEAMRLIVELDELHGRLQRLRRELQRVLDDLSPGR
jgi:hypothetical protein